MIPPATAFGAMRLFAGPTQAERGRRAGLAMVTFATPNGTSGRLPGLCLRHMLDGMRTALIAPLAMAGAAIVALAACGGAPAPGARPGTQQTPAASSPTMSTPAPSTATT